MSIIKTITIEGNGALDYSGCHKKVVGVFTIDGNKMRCDLTSSTTTPGLENPFAQYQIYVAGKKVYDSGYQSSEVFPHANTSISIENIAVPTSSFTLEVRLSISIGYDDNATSSGKYKKSITIDNTPSEPVIENQNIYIYFDGRIAAKDFIISQEFYIDNDGTIYAPSFNTGNSIALDENGLTAVEFIKGIPN